MSAGRFASNVRWQFVANGAQALLGGAYILVLGRVLGPAEFGVFSIVSAYTMVAGLIVELRMQDVVARDFYHADGSAPASPADAEKIVDFLAFESLSRALPCVGLVALSPLLAHVAGLPLNGSELIILAAVGFLVSKAGWGTSTGLLRVMGRTDLIAAFLTADWGTRLLFTAASTFFLDVSVEIALVIALISGGLCNAAQLWVAVRLFKQNVAPISVQGWTIGKALQRTRDTRRLIGANLGVSAADLMAKDLDVAMISSLLPTEKVGLYKLAKSFAQMVWRGIDPFYLAIMPEIRRLWVTGARTELRTLLIRTSGRLLGLAIVLVAVAWALLLSLGERLLGPGYSGLPSLMLMMCVWVVFCAPLVWGHPLAVAINRPELAVIGGVAGSAVGLAAFWILTPAMGLPGAALAWASTTIIGFAFIAITSIHYSKLLRSRS